MSFSYVRTLPAVLVAAAALASGQATAFEVASIKPSDPNSRDGFGTHVREGRIWMENVPLKELIKMAYDVKDFTLSGPSGLVRELDGVRFDIVAKPPEGATRSQYPKMLETLLVERFKLQTHREKK